MRDSKTFMIIENFSGETFSMVIFFVEKKKKKPSGIS